MVLCPHISSEQWGPISLCHIWSNSQFVLHCRAPTKDDGTNTRQSTCSSFWHLCNRMTKPHVQARTCSAEPRRTTTFFVSHLEQARSNCIASSWFSAQNGNCMTGWGPNTYRALLVRTWTFQCTMISHHHLPPAQTCYVGWWAQAERAWHENGRRTNRRQLTGGAHHQMHTGARLPFLDTPLREGKRREERRWEEKHRNYSHISVPARAPLPIMLP